MRTQAEIEEELNLALKEDRKDQQEIHFPCCAKAENDAWVNALMWVLEK